MSDDHQESSDQKPKVRKIVRSAATAERPTFEAAPEGAARPEGAPSGEGGESRPAEGAPAGRKWDVRAERPAGPPSGRGPTRGRPRGPGGPRGGGPRPPREPRPEGAEGASAPTADGERGPRSPRFDRPRRFDDASMPRRPGASGGRAMPVYDRGPLDRSSPEFVDKWLSMPPRKPEERQERPFKKDGGPRSDRQEGEGRPRRDDRDRPRGEKAAPAPVKAQRPEPPPSQTKLPTLHETILVGLPKVAVEGQRDKSANKPKTAKEALAAKTAHVAKPKAEAPEEKGGEIVVDPSWISVSGDRAVAVLRDAGPAAEVLVEQWIQNKNVDAIAEAARSEELSGAARKAARRAVNVLRSRGVTVPERAAAPQAAARAGEEEVTEATFSPPDARGTWSMTIAKRRGGERAHIAEIVIREGTGVVNAVSGWMSRSQIKEAHQRLADSTGVAPAPVPVEWVRWRVQKALEENAKSGQLVPLGLTRCKELLEPAVAAEPTHPSAELEASLGDAAPEATAGLHNEPEFRSWLPDMRAIEDTLRRVGQKLTPDDASDQKKVDEVLREEMKLATDRYFTPEQRAVVAKRMRDAALTIRSRSGDDRAKEVLRTAQAIEKAGLITSPPNDIEFLRVFFQKGIAVLAQQTGGQLRVPVPNAPAAPSDESAG
ncbi:MAG: hypothetical protein HOW73_42440 [Polyangiaceae bacterium]|nr:hypothetical protein [Polyangiaceae bacterium]